MSAILGIDPGVDGGLAVLCENGFPLFVQGFSGVRTQKELVGVVTEAVTVLLKNGGWQCVCEKVGTHKTDGRKGANTFGRVDGLLRGAVLAMRIELHDAPPMLWQAKMECLTGGNKNVSKNRAVELFGGRGIKITHQTADALLIAEFGRRTLLRPRKNDTLEDL